MESEPFASEPPVRDVYDSKAHGYRYSRDDCIAETSIFCRQPKSLVFLPSLLLIRKITKQKSRKGLLSSSAA